MDTNEAIKVCGALATNSRVNALRLIAKAGKKGMPSGEVAKGLNAPQNSLSAQLFLLATAGLVESEREGRNIIYRANAAKIKELVEYLVVECAGGRVKATVKTNG